MYVFHVEIVSRDGVGDGVLGQYMRTFDSVADKARVQQQTVRISMFYSRCHQFRIQLCGVVPQLGLRNSFQILTSLREVRITFHPSDKHGTTFSRDRAFMTTTTDLPETIHMRTRPTLELFLVISLEPDLGVHVDPVYGRSGLYEREIEGISVVGRHDGGLCVLDMLEPFSDHGRLEVIIVFSERASGLFRPR
jgi:hypothetical protein